MQRMILWLTVALLGLTGCITHSVTEKVVDHYDLDIKLRGQKQWFGDYEPLGYDQPVTISAQRLANILGGIEVDTRKKENSPVRERRNAISAKMLLNITQSLPQAFSKASPNQQIIVMALRKQMQKGVFNRKFLTSFTTYVQGNDLYVFFSRIEWQIDESSKNTKIPQPWPGEVVMHFETVKTDGYELVGTQGVRVNWRSAQFGPTVPMPDDASAAQTKPAPVVAPTASAVIPAAPVVAPTATAVIPAAPVVAPTATATSPTAASPPAPVPAIAASEATVAGEAGTPPPQKSDPFQGLTPADLRDLASLEEAYRAGRMDEAQYQRERTRILNRGN